MTRRSLRPHLNQIRSWVRQATVRTRRRHIEQQNRRSTLRFVALVLTLLATAVLVTVAMFQALYNVMG